MKKTNRKGQVQFLGWILLGISAFIGWLVSTAITKSGVLWWIIIFMVFWMIINRRK